MKAIISRRDADIFRQAIRGVAYFWLNALNEESALGNLIVHTPMNQDNEINVRRQALLLVEL